VINWEVIRKMKLLSLSNTVDIFPEYLLIESVKKIKTTVSLEPIKPKNIPSIFVKVLCISLSDNINGK
jgi:hypothetical protein